MVYPSEYRIVFPIYVGHSKYKLGVDVVKCNVPLLLSRETLKRARAKIDIGLASICFLDTNYCSFINIIHRTFVSSNKSSIGLF